MDRAKPLDGLHAAITGGATGLGFAIASAYVEAGARVTILGRREDLLRTAAKRLGANASHLVADIADAARAPAIAEALEAIGPVNVLVNNAGAHQKRPLADVTIPDFMRVIETNLVGTFGLTREVGLRMAQRNSGSIIMITSMAALFGIPQVAAYTASKAALDGLTRQLAVDLGSDGVRVNAIAPGFIETDMNRDIFRNDPKRLEKIITRTPMARLGRPEDVAEAAVFLASPGAAFVTGVSLSVDGGMSIGF